MNLARPLAGASLGGVPGFSHSNPMLPNNLAAVGRLLPGMVIYIATRPAELRITRSAVFKEDDNRNVLR